MSGYIKLTVLRSTLKKQSLKKIETMKNEFFKGLSPNQEDDGYGRTAEWYREQGLKIPEGLDELPERLDMLLTKKDFEFREKNIYIKEERIDYIEDLFDDGCEIIFEDGKSVEVIESSDKVMELINK